MVQWKCFKENMMLNYDPKTNRYSSIEGVEIKASGFGNTTGVESLNDMMYNIIIY